jgi:hypothetical protein
VTAPAPELVIDADLRLDGPRATSRLVGRGRSIELRTATLSGLADLVGLARRLQQCGGGSIPHASRTYFSSISVVFRGSTIGATSGERRTNLPARLLGLSGWRFHPFRLLGASMTRYGEEV